MTYTVKDLIDERNIAMALYHEAERERDAMQAYLQTVAIDSAENAAAEVSKIKDGSIAHWKGWAFFWATVAILAVFAVVVLAGLVVTLAGC